MAPTDTAEQVITVDTDAAGTAQDALHVLKDGELVFAIDSAGLMIVGLLVIPEEDPLVEGAVWNDGGTISVSNGPE